MDIRVNFKKPGAGMYHLILKWGDKLQFYRGRARRLPKDDETVFNTVPIKYITSIEVPPKPEEGANMDNMVSFNREKLRKFKRMYEKTEDGKTFMFEGNEVLKEYAKYVIEFLAPKLEKETRNEKGKK